MRMHSPSHPGELLGEELEERGIALAQVARDLRVSRPTISGIVNGHKPITAEMAVRIGHYIGNGPDIWLKMQASYDLARAAKRMAAELRGMPTAEARSCPR